MEFLHSMKISILPVFSYALLKSYALRELGAHKNWTNKNGNMRSESEADQCHHHFITIRGGDSISSLLQYLFMSVFILPVSMSLSPSKGQPEAFTT